MYPDHPNNTSGGSSRPQNPNNSSASTSMYNQLKPVIKNHLEGLPNEVEVFLLDLMWFILSKDQVHLKQLYENDFNRLSEQFYLSSPWPETQVVERFYESNVKFHGLIGALYTELTYRHLFTKCKDLLTVKGREDSWKNYTDLFNYFNDNECNLRDDPSGSLVLTEQWYWDIHEEFIYQFQDTCQWKSLNAKMASDDKLEFEAKIAELRDNRDMWSAAHVFQSLHRIVISSEIHDYLKHPKPEGVRPNQIVMDLRSLLGYFSMISLMRMYTLTGEYSLAIETVQDIGVSNRNYYARIPSCHASFVYHLSFCYMMLKRYIDASRILSQYLLYMANSGSISYTHSRYTSQITKTVDRMYMMLMLCDLLTPTRLDDILAQNMREKYSDHFNKLSIDNFDLIHEILHFCQPKLINPAYFTFERSEDIILYEEIEKEKNEQPFQILVKELQFQKRINEIFSYASLYHNIQLSKLASFMDIKGPNATETMRAEILSIKHRTRQLVWKDGSLINGDFGSSFPHFEFHLEGDILHIRNNKTQKSLTDDFLKMSNRSQELIKKIRATPKANTAIEA